MTATEWPWSSSMWARVDPTRPHPMITICTAVLPAFTTPAHGIPSRHPDKDRERRTRTCHKLHARPSDRSENDEHNERLRNVSEELELTVTEAAHGGWCVA